MGQASELTTEEKAALWDFVEGRVLPNMRLEKRKSTRKGVTTTRHWVEWEVFAYESDTEYHNFESEDDPVYKLLKKAGY